MTREELYRELIDIIHDGGYHEEETAQDILNAGYRKIPCGKWEWIVDDDEWAGWCCSCCKTALEDSTMTIDFLTIMRKNLF